MANQKEFTQVITRLANGKVRVYNIKDLHIGDKHDPLTTIEITGEYKDVEG
jgi:hypothetical protein